MCILEEVVLYCRLCCAGVDDAIKKIIFLVVGSRQPRSESYLLNEKIKLGNAINCLNLKICLKKI